MRLLVFDWFFNGELDAVPGVSGGTIAFIMGIYEELLNTIKLFNLKFLRMVCKLQFKEVRDYLLGNSLDSWVGA